MNMSSLVMETRQFQYSSVFRGIFQVLVRNGSQKIQTMHSYQSFIKFAGRRVMRRCAVSFKEVLIKEE